MKELTKAEEQIMHILWMLEKAFVKEIIAELPDPKPAYNTVSTIVRILESNLRFGKSLMDRICLGFQCLELAPERHNPYATSPAVVGFGKAGRTWDDE